MFVKSVTGLAVLALSAFVSAQYSSQFAVPDNVTDRTDDYDQVYLAAPSPTYKDLYYLKDLFSERLPGIDYDKYSNSGPTGNITVIHPNSTNIDFTKKILLISCDPEEAWQGDSMARTVQQATSNATLATAIIFYTNKPEQYCRLNVDSVPDYNFFFSLWDPFTSGSLLGNLQTTYLQQNTTGGEIISAQAYTNQQSTGFGGSSGRSTAIAMIILYSITGVITTLFISIIVLGAVRAHRNPERYRMTAGWGRPTNRARGIARAILDTLPIVKYDDGKPKAPPETPDIELGESSAAAADRAGEPKPTATVTSTEVDSHGNEATNEQGQRTKDTVPDQRNAEQPEGLQQSEAQVEDSSGVGCSICTEDFENGQDIRVLPCEHKFHPACVDPWLLDVSSTCPLCRVDLRPEGSRDEEDNEDGLPPPLDPEAGTRPHSLLRRQILMHAVRHDHPVRPSLRMFPNPRPRRSMDTRRRAGTLRRLRAERELLRETVRSERDPSHSSYGGPEPSGEARRRAAILAALEQLPEDIGENGGGESDGSRWARLRIRVRRGRPADQPAPNAS